MDAVTGFLIYTAFGERNPAARVKTMKRTSCSFRSAKTHAVLLISIACSIAGTTLRSDENPVGQWDLKYRVGDRDVTAKLSITLGDSGSLAGKWTSSRGESEISKVTFKDGELSFLRKLQLGERSLELRFEGTIQGDKLAGALIRAQRKIDVTGAREAPQKRPERDREERRRNRERPPKAPPTHANIRYGPHERNVLDFWAAKSEKPTPLVVYIHGGGFRGGRKESINARTLRELLDEGISVAAIHYRLLQTAPLPAAHHDSRRALQFLRSRAKEWNVDKTKVGAFGGSAGAQLCMYLAFHDDMAKASSSDPIERESTRLTCVATSGGQTTMDFDWWKKWIPGYDRPHRPRSEYFGESDDNYKKTVPEVSALSLISSDDPPIFMSYGMNPKDAVPEDPKRAGGWKVHHVMFGVKLREKMDKLGIEADLKYPKAETKYRSNAHFFIEKLKVKRDRL